MLSVVIPAYNEPYLNRTIRSILWNKRGDIEIIVVLDGCDQDVLENHRVHVIKLPERRGMRHAINTGVRMARGEYIMKTDAHCKFAKGFDRTLTRHAKDAVVVPRKYDLDLDNWQETGDPIDHQRLIKHPKYNKFHGEKWKGKKLKKPVEETMAFQGSCYVMHKDWWDRIAGLDETIGPIGHESVEISMKTWQNGGMLLLDTETWYAHPDSAERTHKISKKKLEGIWDEMFARYGDYYERIIRPRWLK